MPPKKSKKTKRTGTTKKKSKRTCGRKGYIALYDANGDIRCVSKNSPDAVKQLKIMEHKDKCPKPQRPKKLGRTLPCPMNSMIKKNAKGHHCCYVFKKLKTTKTTSTKKKATTKKKKATTTTKKKKATTATKKKTTTQPRKTLYSRISQKYTLAKKDKKELPGLKNLCAKLFGKKRFMVAKVKDYVHLLNVHNEARKTKTVSDELKKFREIKKLKTENQITRLFEIFEYIVNNSKRTPNKTKEISETSTTQTSSEPATTSAPYFDKYGRYHAQKKESENSSDNSTTQSESNYGVVDTSKMLFTVINNLDSNEYIRTVTPKQLEQTRFLIMTQIENWCIELFRPNPKLPKNNTELEKIFQRKNTNHMSLKTISNNRKELETATVNVALREKYKNKWKTNNDAVINNVLSLLNRLEMFHDEWKNRPTKKVQREESDTTTSTNNEESVTSSTEDDSDSEEENDKYF